MKDKYVHFEEYCRSKGSALAFHVERINKNNIDYTEALHIYGSILKFIDDITETSQRLDITEHQLNIFDNNLTLLDSNKYRSIYNYLNKYNYIQNQQKAYQTIMPKIVNKIHLKENEIDFLNFLIEHDKIEDDKLLYVFEYFTRLIFEKIPHSRIINFDNYKKIFAFYAKNILDNKYDIEFSNTQNRSLNKNKIILGEPELINFFYTGNGKVWFSLFKSEYIQNKISGLIDTKPDFLDDEQKDLLVALSKPEYYKANKPNLIFEKKATLYGTDKFEDFVKKLGFQVKQRKPESNIYDDINETKREYNGKKSSLELIFKDTINELDGEKRRNN